MNCARTFIFVSKQVFDTEVYNCLYEIFIYCFLNSIDFSIPKEDANKHMNLLIMKCVQAYCLMVNLCIFP